MQHRTPWGPVCCSTADYCLSLTASVLLGKPMPYMTSRHVCLSRRPHSDREHAVPGGPGG
eukprot:5874-Eustigmatos_ZCMA.PRE.1